MRSRVGCWTGGLYEVCVQRLCEHVAEQGKQLLVVLPPETLPAEKYHPAYGQTQERTARFNALWRRAFQLFPGISTLESDVAFDASEMIDVNHYSPAALQTVGQIVDQWREQVQATGPTEGRLAA